MERAALRKFDKWLVPVAFIFLVLSSLDRNNIGNARTFGFEEDLGLEGNKFGNITTLLSVTLVLFEVPWLMKIKRFGPNRALGTALVLWSFVTHAGVSPGFSYLFSTIYPPEAAGKRIMMTNLANCTSGAFGGLFAYARWLFIVEFCLTAVVGEQETMHLRKKREILYRGEGDSNVKWLKPSFTDPFIYLVGLAFFTSSVAITGIGVFLPTIIEGLGYASLQVQYMTIPVYILGAICLVTNGYLSPRWKRRAPFLVRCTFPVMVGYLICVGASNPHAGYAGMFILVIAVAMPYAYSIANLSSLVSAQLYPSHQGPRYIQANSISAGLDVVATGLYFACWMLLRRRDLKKNRMLADGATTNGYEDDRGLHFKYLI
ncbi:major facilitator superfamily domain-containing protein [Aspergillus multicolor]|uniref:major facilitator superfamily domain-containing protein n=1 Tax=Aspergillus multicolor TaxID=41759 RepID=UPI003CCCDB91